METHADENDVTDLPPRRCHRRRPVNEAVGELTREAMKICEEMQRLNAAVNTGMLALRSCTAPSRLYLNFVHSAIPYRRPARREQRIQGAGLPRARPFPIR